MRHYLADLTGSTEVLGTLTASNIMYPSSDGTSNQVIQTDGSGRLSFTSTVDSASHAVFAEDAASATTANTASYVSSSNIDGDIEANSIAYSNITGVPAGLVSGSTQITALGFISESFSTAGTGILSGSAQIASEISGAFTADSASFSSSIASLQTFSSSLDATFATEAELNSATQSLSQSIAADIEDILDGTSTVPSASNAANAVSSSYVSASNIDGSITADSVAFTNVTGVPAGIVSSSAQTVANLPDGTLSSSAQVTAHGFISESFSTAGTGILSGSAQISSEISGSLGANATLIRSLTAAGISGSLGANATLIRSLTATNISGSFNSVSASLASDIASISDTDVDVNVSNLTTRLGQISGDVSVGGASSTVTIPGNLTVQGTRTELQVSQLNVEDTLITVASGAANSAAADGAGLFISGANESITWDHGNSRFLISDDIHVDGTINLPEYIYHAGDTNTYMQFNAADSWRVVTGGTERISATGQGIVINNGSDDQDFRVESNNNQYMLFVDGGNDRVGIGTSSPSFPLDVTGTASADYFTGSFVGDGSGLTGISGYSVTNEANNRIVTSTGTGAGNAEANLTFTPVTSTYHRLQQTSTGHQEFRIAAGTFGSASIYIDGNTTGGRNVLGTTTSGNLTIVHNGNERLRITDTQIQNQGGSQFSGSFIGDGSGLTGLEAAAGTVSSSAQITAHGFISSSLAFTTITNPFTGSFTGSFAGDGSELTGITASIVPTTLVSESFSNVNTYTVTHELDTKEVLVQVYDSNDNIIVPSNIQAPTTSTVILTFAQNRSGRVVVAKAGHVVSGSANSGITGGTGVTVSNSVVSIAQAVGTGDDLQFDSLGIGTAASSVTGEIRATNDITAYYSSDERLKENIIPIEGSLDKVAQLGGYEFDWIPKEGIHSHEGHDIGVIAQEVEAVFPELVTTRDNGYKAVQYEKLTAVLLSAVKELTARVEELEKKQ